ncbi:Phophatidylserine decarboxylase-domain-containing protein [Usnea florida]
MRLDLSKNNCDHENGRWLPLNPQVTKKWLHNLIRTLDRIPERGLKPELKEFQDHIEEDVTLKILASLMFTEVPTKPPYNNDPLMKSQVRDYRHMLQLVNHVMDNGPEWSQIADQTDIIGFPISAILEWPMNTCSGNAFFLRKDVNEHWAKILGSWAKYLSSADSASVLTDAPDGWLSPRAISELMLKGNNGTSTYSFEQLYICDPNAPHHGYTSWDHFFTRQFRDGVRPLSIEGFEKAAQHTRSSIIHNACESSPVFLRRGNEVSKSAPFWLKGQPYSLDDMLVHDDLTPHFVGGTLYQAFLSALTYHRWHSPVSGTIVKAFNVPGTYYSANYFHGFPNTDGGGPDAAAPNHSQAYITSVAARAVIFIEADSRDVGLMAFIAVGMSEVSSNEITVRTGQRVEAGEQLGMFHYGGSTHCLLFRRGVEVEFALEPNHGSMYDPPPECNLPVRSAIAVVRRGV